MAVLVALVLIPLDHRPNTTFMYSSGWKPLRDYFSFEVDVSSMKFEGDEKYIFFEFPHGIFPMGQFLSASLIEEMFPGKMICGLGASVIFQFPVMRHVMAMLGTRIASPESVKKIFDAGHHAAVIPGGIAEMFLSSDEQECIYFRKRFNTVKNAIQNGAHIVPTFFFGNTHIFSVSSNSSSWVSKILSRVSRRLRMSMVFFYGRFGCMYY